MKKAFLTGITGQDGSYLAELLLSKNYEVHGLVRDLNTLPQSNISHLLQNKALILHQGALENFAPISALIQEIIPDEIYHLASPSNVRQSLINPPETIQSIGLGATYILETLRKMDKPPKFLNTASGEIFAPYQGTPHNENSPIAPITPYGAAKALAFQMTSIYRNVYKLPVCSAIPFSHESSRRKPEFVTRKVAQTVAKIKKGLQKDLILNNLTAQRDWGWAPDYVQGMWLILQQETLEDFVLATGKINSMEGLVDTAFSHVGLNWRDYVKFDSKLMPIVEIPIACGDSTKAQQKLGWQPTISFHEMIHRMVDEEMKNLT